MTVIPMPAQGSWAWDARGEGRAIRVSTHRESGLLNLSLWRGDFCVGSLRLLPEEVARLVGGLTAGLAQLAGPSAAESGAGEALDASRLQELEQRLAVLESQARPGGLRLPRPLAQGVVGALRTWRRRWAWRQG